MGNTQLTPSATHAATQRHPGAYPDDRGVVFAMQHRKLHHHQQPQREVQRKHLPMHPFDVEVLPQHDRRGRAVHTPHPRLGLDQQHPGRPDHDQPQQAILIPLHTARIRQAGSRLFVVIPERILRPFLPLLLAPAAFALAPAWPPSPLRRKPSAKPLTRALSPTSSADRFHKACSANVRVNGLSSPMRSTSQSTAAARCRPRNSTSPRTTIRFQRTRRSSVRTAFRSTFAASPRSSCGRVSARCLSSRAAASAC